MLGLNLGTLAAHLSRYLCYHKHDTWSYGVKSRVSTMQYQKTLSKVTDRFAITSTFWLFVYIDFSRSSLLFFIERMYTQVFNLLPSTSKQIEILAVYITYCILRVYIHVHANAEHIINFSYIEKTNNTFWLTNNICSTQNRMNFNVYRTRVIAVFNYLMNILKKVVKAK